MAGARRNRVRQVQLGFDALSIEGVLLSAEWLSRVAQLGAGVQSEADYRIPKGLNLRDEIGRYWRIAQAHWVDFSAGRGASGDAKAVTERFAVALLRDCFGFTSLVEIAPVVLADRTFPIGRAALGGRVPVVVVPADLGLDAPAPVFGDGGRRRSAFGLTQEYLNAQEGALWGIASDGTTIRILRDNASLTRPAWIEADLQRIFLEERYADFAALWLLLHESRFGREEQPVTECALETWRNAGRDEGTVARSRLRDGFQKAVHTLGQGFLAHPENQSLRAALQAGSLTTKDYFTQLLRLVYRLIFLLTVEERDLLHPVGTAATTKDLYSRGYGMRRLRERAVRRGAHDRFSDLWEGTKIVFRGLATGEARLGLPALGGIFAKGQCAAVDAAKLENWSLLHAIFSLGWLREDGSLARVNWRDMGSEELGSVYESLLELVPRITKDGREFGFATGDEARGNARKTTGSYYTPESLVQVLLDSALEPVVATTVARNPHDPAASLLSLSIVDPACGSGHFLLAGARRLATHVARLQANGTPSAAEYRHALRQVVGRCIYGVDLNPMAVELCKVSLWMEALEPGLPLTFLDSHIQQGNALLGTTADLMSKGIPDDAWDPIKGDDKKVAGALKKRNRAERTSPNLAFEFSATAEGASIAILSQMRALDAAPDVDAAGLAHKETTWRELLGSAQFRARRLAADAWCAAFVWRKESGALANVAPTQEEWERLRNEPGSASPTAVAEVDRLTREYDFFHWHIQFPQVFAKGGFDVVLGNPPWERLKVQTDEWMSSVGIDLSSVSNAAARDALLDKLVAEDPELERRWIRDRRHADAIDQLVRGGGRYPRTAFGDVNSYALFAELGVSMLGPEGRGCWILPLGIVSDKTYGDLCTSLMKDGRLNSVYGFVNERQLFPDVLHNFKFVSFSVGPPQSSSQTTFVFGLLDPTELPGALSRRSYHLTAGDVQVLNPETLTCPVFIDGRMAQVMVKLHRSLQPLGRSDWMSKPRAMLHMGAASKHFSADRERSTDVAVFESKMVNRYNHRFGTFEGLGAGERSHMLPRSTGEQLRSATYEATSGYFFPAEELPELGGPRTEWLCVFRRIANPSLARTSAFCVIPPVGVADSLSVLVPRGEVSAPNWSREIALLCWLGNSIVFDAVLKQKMGGNNFSEYVWEQLPIPTLERVTREARWLGGARIDDFAIARVCELSVTSQSVVPFARDLGYGARPFLWNDARRRQLEAELDAAAAVVFGLSRADFDTLFDAFPVLRNREVETDGEFVTRTAALRVYDALVDAERTGKAYQSPLSPGPADRLAAHGSIKDGAPAFLPPAAEPDRAPAPKPLWMARTPVDRQVLILARAVDAHNRAGAARLATLGNVKAEKIVYLVEALADVDLEREPVREAAGPADFPRLKSVVHRAGKLHAFKVDARRGGAGGVWSPDGGIAKRVAEYRDVFADKCTEIDHVIDVTVPMDSAQAEIVATLFACWNDLLANGEQPDEERIISDFYGWSEGKASYEQERLHKALAWMREKGIVPTGRVKPTVAERAPKQARKRRAPVRGEKGSRR